MAPTNLGVVGPSGGLLEQHDGVRLRPALNKAASTPMVACRAAERVDQRGGDRVREPSAQPSASRTVTSCHGPRPGTSFQPATAATAFASPRQAARNSCSRRRRNSDSRRRSSRRVARTAAPLCYRSSTRSSGSPLQRPARWAVSCRKLILLSDGAVNNSTALLKLLERVSSIGVVVCFCLVSMTRASFALHRSSLRIQSNRGAR